VDEETLPTLETWFEDPELRRRLGGTLPLRRWFSYVDSQPGRFAWMAYEEGKSVGMVDLEAEPDGTGWVAHLVKPELRGRGYGRRILEAMLAQPEVSRLKVIKGGIEPDNVAALRCCQAVGFVLEGDEPDEEGFLTVSCRPATEHG